MLLSNNLFLYMGGRGNFLMVCQVEDVMGRGIDSKISPVDRLIRISEDRGDFLQWKAIGVGEVEP